MQLWANALKEHPLVKDGTVKVTVFDGKYDALTQNNQFETMVTQKYDGILFVPIDVKAGAEAVDKAAAANIPVVGSNTRVDSDKLVSYVGSNDVIAGEMEAESVIKAMGGKGNVVIIEGPIGQSAQIERRKGNQNVLAKYPNVKVLEMKTANWSRAESLSLMENWLTAHAGKINGVIGQNDEMALGAIEAIKAKGISNRRVLWRHALRPSSLTMLTVAGLNVGTLIGGAVVVEFIFGIPGMGKQLYTAIFTSQYVELQSLVIVIALMFVLVNVGVDLLYTVLDPRIRRGRTAA